MPSSVHSSSMPLATPPSIAVSSGSPSGRALCTPSSWRRSRSPTRKRWVIYLVMCPLSCWSLWCFGSSCRPKIRGRWRHNTLQSKRRRADNFIGNQRLLGRAEGRFAARQFGRQQTSVGFPRYTRITSRVLFGATRVPANSTIQALHAGALSQPNGMTRLMLGHIPPPRSKVMRNAMSLNVAGKPTSIELREPGVAQEPSFS